MKRFLAVASVDYDDHDFESCMNRNMPTDYCMRTRRWRDGQRRVR